MEGYGGGRGGGGKYSSLETDQRETAALGERVRDGGREREREAKRGALVEGHGRETAVLGKRDRQTDRQIDERDGRGGVL